MDQAPRPTLNHLPICHPDSMALAGALRGLTTARPDACRVLELACGDGTNLLPLAYHLRGSEFVGLESSRPLVEAARRNAEILGITNVSFQDDLVATEQGVFDYIIVNDIFSYVTDDARAGVFDLFDRLLAEEGVAFVCFNASGSWSFRRTLRSLLGRVVESETSAEAKLGKARTVLEHLGVAGLDERNPFIRIAKFEVELARKVGDDDFWRMYLSPELREFTFAEFSDAARARGFAVFDEVRTMSASLRVEAQLRSRLSTVLVRLEDVESFVEFLTAPLFRAPLLCRATTLERARPGVASLGEPWEVAAHLTTRNPDVILEDGIEVPFKTPTGQLHSSKQAAAKALLVALMKAWPAGLTVDELLRDRDRLLIEKGIAPVGSDAEARRRTAREAVELREAGVAAIRTRKPVAAAQAPARPTLAELNRWQASRGALLTSRHHALVSLDDVSRPIAVLLDGTRTRDEVVSALRGAFEAGHLVVVEQKPGDRERFLASLPKIVDDAIAAFVAAGLVEPETISPG